ncbi:DSD1 family PLP-dependent enzyme [Sinimarinibacterium sp. CAU 1509]|uniref:DSD1 family PLP-dependent enzyme n=1 Tax=Sinimarinibacterium sp. CAU 1509 TaxID=2562283 RepID=UPI0010AB7C37|nr:DSD1 family PLP-dependent enzyme [Sinimarinibacterium sp. CAU 1509]TJY60817.1 DSD1 family PLP-dependent enzyme [Sinimarinibacterium sp. CAU 1509]
MSNQPVNRRRRALLGAALLAPVAAAVALKPRELGGGHNEAFLRMQTALRDAGLFRPTLVIDRASLLHNIGRLKANLPKSKHYRIVAKSLPSLDLIRTVRQLTGTDRLMVFHQPFLNLVAKQMPDASLLVGKPMPIGAAARFFEHLTDATVFDPAAQVDWLIDTTQRLQEYRDLARANVAAGSAPMRVNLELDIGLHRGGFRTAEAVAEVIQVLKAEPSMRFSGFMGYEAHASKMPGILGGPQKALDKAMAQYSSCVDVARELLGSDFDPDALVLNAGGSSTYELYTDASPCNEVSMGSGLVMPTDFDKPTLADHRPAAYIATPVLKALDRTDLPGLESMTGLFSSWDPNAARTFYTYGGYWHADTVSPPGLQHNAIWGHSTNQEMLNGSAQVQLAVDDFVFYRPHQSEFVFLEFGDIAVYAEGRIVDSWPVFSQGA